MITSFSNPNYDADALNSNLPSNQYYSDTDIYDSVDYASSSNDINSKHRRKYNESGVESNALLSRGSSLNSPDSTFSVDSRNSLDSGLTSPTEKTNLLVEVEHAESDSGDDGCKPQGFMGYYASLERSARSRQSKSKRVVDSEDDKSEDESEQHSQDQSEKSEDKSSRSVFYSSHVVRWFSSNTQVE